MTVQVISRGTPLKITVSQSAQNSLQSQSHRRTIERRNKKHETDKVEGTTKKKDVLGS